MQKIHSEASNIINAKPEQVYTVLADYHNGHPHILPKQYFPELQVKHGGIGAGTIVEVQTRVLGVKKIYHLVVSEPKPGQVLQEDDPEAGLVTTFTVTPVNNGQQTRLKIATDWERKPGLTGFMESIMNPLITRRIYKKELLQIAEYLRNEPK